MEIRSYSLESLFSCVLSPFEQFLRRTMAGGRCEIGKGVRPFSSHCYRGGNRYSVMAKTRYTASTSTPTNHADRPLFVTSVAVPECIVDLARAPKSLRCINKAS